MAGNNTGALIKYGLIGVGGYFLWGWWQKRTPGTPDPAAAGVAPTGVAFNSLDQIYQRLAAAVGSSQYTADGFNVYLKQVGGVATPPDPAAVFTAAGWNREAPMSLAQYWASIAPYLKTNMGMSGLGIYGGLGALMGRA